MIKKQFRYENKNGVNFKSNNVSKENFMAQTVSTNKILNTKMNNFYENTNDINIDMQNKNRLH